MTPLYITVNNIKVTIKVSIVYLCTTNVTMMRPIMVLKTTAISELMTTMSGLSALYCTARTNTATYRTERTHNFQVTWDSCKLSKSTTVSLLDLRQERLNIGPSRRKWVRHKSYVQMFLCKLQM